MSSGVLRLGCCEITTFAPRSFRSAIIASVSKALSIARQAIAKQSAERAGESRLGLSRRIESENHRNLTTNATREQNGSRYVHTFNAQISKRDCPGREGAINPSKVTPFMRGATPMVSQRCAGKRLKRTRLPKVSIARQWFAKQTGRVAKVVEIQRWRNLRVKLNPPNRQGNRVWPKCLLTD